MAGSSAGGKLAAKKNKQNHGDDYYRKIGAIGGSKGNTGGFYRNSELARRAGALGGRVSRKPKKETI